MLTFEQAQGRIRVLIPKPRAQWVKLSEALDRTLAKALKAPIDLPGFDNTAVDGYALGPAPRAKAAAPKSLVPFRVIGTAQAGRPFPGRVGSAQAVRLFTGAAIPAGTQTVIMQEETVRVNGCVLIQPPLTSGRHIRRRGEEIRRGMSLLSAGMRLRPQEIGLLAAMGMDRVPVYPAPRVGLLVTGDELLSPGERLVEGRIYDSNRSLLQALIRRSGAQVVSLGLARDRLSELKAKLKRGLEADLLVVAGGVSVGERDLVRKAAGRCGIREVFWRVDMKPGMPLFFGKHNRTLVFGLPGNPVSVYVTFEEFVRPVIRRLCGLGPSEGYTESARLSEPLSVSARRKTHFIRVASDPIKGRSQVRALTGQGSHQLHSLSSAEGWIRMEARQGFWPAGTRVLVKWEEPSCS